MEREPIIGITMGDAAGIGPEIVLKSLGSGDVAARCVVIGDAEHLKRVSFRCSGNRIETTDLDPMLDPRPGVTEVFDLNNLPGDAPIGVDSLITGKAAAENIVAAVKLWQRGKIDAICTAPISKKAINMAGYDFPGHTEMLASLTGTEKFAMSFFADKLRVVLLSTHHSLLDAIAMVKHNAIADLIRFTAKQMKQILGRDVSIAVAGLNPHASEDGKFGNEERDEIIPAIEECKGAGINVSGPYSPDTVFLRGHRGEFDAVIAMYHDQATIAVKSISFGHGVNVTLGLPFIRTSVDHGTAYDIAGKGVADASSMTVAINLAAELAKRSRAAA
ncbi:MAG TPA: 4-hydroxythreonine-4-phosphate dehydrogenase PdxA [Pyrinomonadaceae bacterium]|jgi:4-hydroxythreonine-4-phosphate dehydrogenase|nr:4-hydroxythreonine-4-phosphate dehydrogenase PdxA [Pyrinomonadaceae bacterium]